MPKSKTQGTAPGSYTSSGKKAADPGRLDQISRSTSQIVKDAAALLDEELAAGIVTANQVQQRFRKEGRIDARDFSSALQRFQTDAHEVIRLLNDRLNEMRSQENFDLVKNLVDRSHDMVDLAVELVNGSAEVANQLANSPILKQDAGRRGKRKR
jgi:hypothetical protein